MNQILKQLKLLGIKIRTDESLPDFLISWLKTKNLSDPFLGYYLNSHPLSDFESGNWRVFGVRSIYSNDSEFKTLGTRGYLPIGACSNGDLIAMNTASEEVVFVTFEGLSNESNFCEFSKIVSTSYDDFLQRVHLGSLPMDYFAA